MNEPTHIDLFSGIGGFTLAAGWAGYRTTQFVECSPYAQAVLKKKWPGTPVHSDIKDYHPESSPRLLTAGVPCQPASCAGDMRGEADKHSRWLWPEAIRVIREARPLYALMENPTGLLSVDGGRAYAGILSDLHASGYDLWWETLGANSIGAFHRRERLWLLAADSKRCERWNQPHGWEIGRVGREQQPLPWNEPPESALRRLRGVDDGSGYTSQRVDTIRNSIVPQVAYEIIKLTTPNKKETTNG